MNRFIVLQMGARMHYAVPALLARHEMLDRVYVDSDMRQGALPAMLRFWPKELHPKLIRRLTGHRLPDDIPVKCVRAFPVQAILERAGLGKFESHVRRQVLSDGFGSADAVYSYINGDLSVTSVARSQGLSVVHEQILNPDVGFILREERERFPGIESQDPLQEVELGLRRDRRQWEISSRILVPSQFVWDSCLAAGADIKKLRMVPYGISEEWLERKPAPRLGRVLFLGSVGLRKGNHYLAEACRILHHRRMPAEFRVVGPYDPTALRSSLFEGPTYIGQVPRSEIAREFLSADMFVLPTISDSFALVHLEALASGVPVITTPHCGSVVRDGVEGYIVPIRSATALADRIEQLIINRHQRERMSINARLRAAEFTWKRYEARLLEAIRN